MSEGDLDGLGQLVTMANQLGVPAMLAWIAWHLRGLCAHAQTWRPYFRVELIRGGEDAGDR